MHNTINIPRQYLIFFFVLLQYSLCIAQSPWTRSKGGFYAQMGYNMIPTYSQQFGSSDSQGDRQLEREISDGTFQIYGEYGFSKKTTAILNTPFRFLRSGNLTASNSDLQNGSFNGIGNSSLALRHLFFKKKLTLSGQVQIDFPSRKYDDETGIRRGYDAWTLTPTLSTGMGFRKAYWFAYSGYGYRGNEYSDFVKSGIEIGKKISKVYLIAYSEWQHSLENGSVVLPQNNLKTGLYIDEQSYWSFGGKVIYSYNRFAGLGVSYAGAFDAANLPKSPGLGLFAYFKWD